MPAEGDAPVASATGFRESDLILVGDGEFATSIDALVGRAGSRPRRLWIGKQPDPAAAEPSEVVHVTNTDQLIEIIGDGHQARVFFAARMPLSDWFKGDQIAEAGSISQGDFTRTGQLRALASYLERAGYVPSKFADIFPELCLRSRECIGPPCDHGAFAAAAAHGHAALVKSKGSVAMLGVTGDVVHKSGRSMTADDYFESPLAKKTAGAKLAYIKSRMPVCPLDDEAITPGLVRKIAAYVQIAIVAPGMMLSDRDAVLEACTDHGLALCAAQEF